jgi:hypothetical protein
MLASPAIEAGISIFPHAGWVDIEGTRAKGASHNFIHITINLNSTQYILKFSHRFFSFQSILVYKIKHTVTHDCTEPTSPQARSGHHGTSIHLLVRHESSSMLRVLFNFYTQSILTFVNYQTSTDPTHHCVLRHRRSLCGVEMASSHAAN